MPDAQSVFSRNGIGHREGVSCAEADRWQAAPLVSLRTMSIHGIIVYPETWKRLAVCSARGTNRGGDGGRGNPILVHEPARCPAPAWRVLSFPRIGCIHEERHGIQ